MSIMIPAWVDGKLTPVEKLEAHVRGLRHRAISVFVLNGTRVLIQQRAAGKYHTPGLWANTCCTHPNWGEDSLTCANRRLDEELGITGLSLLPRGTLEYRAEVGNGLIEHEVVDVFTADASADLSMDLNPDEVQAVRWVDLYDLAAEAERHPDRFTPWLRIYMRDHMDAIFGVLNRA